ncbi:hypothetical protein DL96DRAFT_236097 [Flagelloscypha sp. PMI_526]|nr:hypothetical protein DL96DRAFT_236097 [Flagelloscypha sp. PMI_526]
MNTLDQRRGSAYFPTHSQDMTFQPQTLYHFQQGNYQYLGPHNQMASVPSAYSSTTFPNTAIYAPPTQDPYPSAPSYPTAPSHAPAQPVHDPRPSYHAYGPPQPDYMQSPTFPQQQQTSTQGQSLDQFSSTSPNNSSTSQYCHFCRSSDQPVQPRNMQGSGGTVVQVQICQECSSANELQQMARNRMRARMQYQHAVSNSHRTQGGMDSQS